MRGSHRILFGSAAVLNLVAGLPLLLAPSVVSRIMGIAASPAEQLFMQIAGLAVVGFAWIYRLISRDPTRYRPLVVLGLILKAGVVVLVYGYWLAGSIGYHLPALAFSDIVFAALFLAYYLVTASTRN